MAKLHFNYSVMNAGKSMHLLTVAHNYVENGGKVMLFTSARDDRSGNGKIRSRLGNEADAIAISEGDNILEIVREEAEKGEVTAVLVDELQFMTAQHVWQMSDVVDDLEIPVMAYGLKNNSLGKLFGPAVETILALANESNEIKQVCHCGSKATMILRYNPDGSVVKSGEVVETGAEDRYVSVCRYHWKTNNIGPRARRAVFDAGYGPRVICASCGVAHEIVLDDEEQGYDCAAICRGGVISGYYGSAVADGTQFSFTGERPDDVKEGVICDACIRKNIERGCLVER